MKPKEVDYLFIGSGIAPLLCAFKCRTSESSFFLLNPLNDYFIEDLDLDFDPDWAISSLNNLPLPFEEQKNYLNEFFPGSVHSLFHKKDHLYIKGDIERQWNATESSFVKNFNLLKPIQLSETQTSLRIPGLNLKGESPHKISTLFPKSGALEVIPYRNAIYEFLREHHAHQIQTFSLPIKIHPDFIQYKSNDSTHTIKAKKIIIFWSPGISKWFENTMNVLDLQTTKPFKRIMIEDYKILSRDPIDPSTISTIDHFSSHAYSHSKNFLLSIYKKSESNSFFSESSFLEIKSFILEFLKWKTFSIRSLSLKTYSIIGDKPTRESFKIGDSTLEVFHSADGPILRTIEEIKNWLSDETLL